MSEPEHDKQKLRIDADGEEAILFADRFDAAKLQGGG